MAKDLMNPSSYPSAKSVGAKRKKTTMGAKDPIYREAVKQPPNLKAKCKE